MCQRMPVPVSTTKPSCCGQAWRSCAQSRQQLLLTLLDTISRYHIVISESLACNYPTHSAAPGHSLRPVRHELALQEEACCLQQGSAGARRDGLFCYCSPSQHYTGVYHCHHCKQAGQQGRAQNRHVWHTLNKRPLTWPTVHCGSPAACLCAERCWSCSGVGAASVPDMYLMGARTDRAPLCGEEKL